MIGTELAEAGFEVRFPPNEVERAIQAAIGAFGAEVLAPGPDGEVLALESVGRRVLRLAFGPDDGELPRDRARPGPRSGQRGRRRGTVSRGGRGAEPRPGQGVAARDLIVGLCRRRAAAGDAQALVELGDLLRRDDPEGARAAYQQAVDAGHRRALFDLAEVTRKLAGGDDATLAFYRKAAASADPDWPPRPWIASWACTCPPATRPGPMKRCGRSSMPGVRSGRPWRWRAWPTASARASRRLRKRFSGGPSTLASTGASPPTRRAPSVILEQGDLAGAKAVWRKLIDERHPYWADGAFLSLVNLLRDEQDVDGLRALHQVASNWTIPTCSMPWTSSGKS